MKANLHSGRTPGRPFAGPPRAQGVSAFLKALASRGRSVLPGLRPGQQPPVADAGDETAMQAHCL